MKSNSSKLILIFILIVASVVSSKAQNTRADTIFSELMNDTSDFLGVEFGFIGVNSNNFNMLSYLTRAERFDLMEKLLYSESNANAYYSAKVLIYAQRNGFWVISDSGQLKISELKESGRRVSIIYHGWSSNFSLEHLLKPNVFNHSVRGIQKEIRKDIKYYWIK